jgi:hypothetical protein
MFKSAWYGIIYFAYKISLLSSVNPYNVRCLFCQNTSSNAIRSKPSVYNAQY